MKFVDEIELKVKAGDGGRGCISFRRERFVPKGGPDGGNGGDGGDIIFIATTSYNTLSHLRGKKLIKAKRGEHGKGKDQYGKKGEDAIIYVPVGTLIRDKKTGKILADLIEDGQKIIVAKGGRGGRGNKCFVTSTNQAPYYAEEGKSGEEKELLLELKLLADVGLIGYPNAGKSTLISVISNAKPKIAEYPFTTLSPNLGVVDYNETFSFVIADIPGLIEGAAEGKGLGLQFLKHIERTKIFVHLLDSTELDSDKIAYKYFSIRKELKKYNENLLKKPEIVVLTKIDALQKDKIIDLLKELTQKINKKIIPISSIARQGLDILLKEIYNNLKTKF